MSLTIRRSTREGVATGGWDAAWRNSCIADPRDVWVGAGWVLFLGSWLLFGRILLFWLMLYGAAGDTASKPFAFVAATPGTCSEFRARLAGQPPGAEEVDGRRCVEVFVAADGRLRSVSGGAGVAPRDGLPPAGTSSWRSATIILRPASQASAQSVLTAHAVVEEWAARLPIEPTMVLGKPFPVAGHESGGRAR